MPSTKGISCERRPPGIHDVGAIARVKHCECFVCICMCVGLSEFLDK